MPHKRLEQAEMRSPNASKCNPKGAGSRRRDSVGSLQRIARVCEKGAKESRAEAHLERGEPRAKMVSDDFPLTPDDNGLQLQIWGGPSARGGYASPGWAPGSLSIGNILAD